jgi:O-antigen/teichoic acid export membrane protein
MLLFLILALPVTGLNQTLQAWCTRRKAFKTSAHSQMVRPACSLGIQVAAGVAHLGWGGLVTGSIAGDAAATAVLARESLRSDASLLRRAFRWAHLKAVGREYLDFPLYSMPQNVLNAASQGIPVLLLTRYFGPAMAGSYALGMRVLQAPMSLVLTSVRQVLLQRATEVHNHGQRLWPLLVRSTGLLAVIAFGPSVLIALLAPVVFRWAFGPEWGLAGECARWLVLWLGLMFCNLPAALLGRILRQQRNLLIFDVLLLAARVTALVVAARTLTPVQTVMVFSLVGFAFNAFFILWIAALVLRHDRRLTASAQPAGQSAAGHTPQRPVPAFKSVVSSP